MASWCQRGRRCGRTRGHPRQLLIVCPCEGYIAPGGKSHLFSGTSLGDSQTHAKNGVGTQLGLVRGSIEAVEELIHLGLILDVDALADESRSDDGVDVLNGLGYTLATPLGLVSIAKLTSLVLTYFLGYFMSGG